MLYSQFSKTRRFLLFEVATDKKVSRVIFPMYPGGFAHPLFIYQNEPQCSL